MTLAGVPTFQELFLCLSGQVLLSPKHLGAFRLGDYLPTIHAAYIRDYPLVNIVYQSAVAAFYLHHVTSVPLVHILSAGYPRTIPNNLDMHSEEPSEEIGG